MLGYFEDKFHDNESALALLRGLIEHLFTLKALSGTQKEEKVLIELSDLKIYLNSYLLAPSKEI